MKVRKLPEQEERVETGITQFDNDWPGIFIRGDMAMVFAIHIEDVLLVLEDKGIVPDSVLDAVRRTDLANWAKLLKSCNEKQINQEENDG